ncbi:hypothetical protein FXO37_11811 [Capsicum annuum]|nr:hypothetical protein FXO37_11811 [Capsicum annuum]
MARERRGRPRKIPLEVPPASEDKETHEGDKQNLTQIGSILRGVNEIGSSSSTQSQGKSLLSSAGFITPVDNPNPTVSILHHENEVKEEDKCGASPAEPWVNLFKKSRSTENWLALSYIPPQVVKGEVVVQLEKDEIDKEIEKWR